VDARKTGTAQLLFGAALDMGLQPSWIVPNNLFAIMVDGKEEYVNFARSPLNSAVSVSLAKNKYFTRMILDRHGVRNIPFTRSRTIEAAEVFLSKHGKIVAKPLEGSGSQDIHIITTSAQLRNLEINKYILEKYIGGKEVRYLVLNDSVLAVHESEYGISVSADRPLRRISYPRSMWDHHLSQESLRIMRMLQLRFAAIDYMIDEEGHSYLLEVNTAPGLKWFHAPSVGPIVDVAKCLLEAMQGRQKPRGDIIRSKLLLAR
jgi:hypothetical protein